MKKMKKMNKVIADMTIRGIKLVNLKFNNHRRL